MSTVREGVFTGSLTELADFVRKQLGEMKEEEEAKAKGKAPKEETKGEEKWEDIPQSFKDSIAESVEKAALCVFKDVEREELPAFNSMNNPFNALFDRVPGMRRKYEYFENAIKERVQQFYAVYDEYKSMGPKF